MSTLMQASNQWASRPNDERFLSLDALHAHAVTQKQNSKAAVLANRDVQIEPVGDDHKGLVAVGPQGQGVNMTNWSFGQLASLAGAPAGYLKTLPSEMIADNLNYGLHKNRDVEDIGLLLTRTKDASLEPESVALSETQLRAATGPNYGRIWNADIVNHLRSVVGDGVTGDWRVPGEFGKPVVVNKNNTTLYAGDRDMFVFLADEKNLIEVPDPKGGKRLMSRGFFTWNSEVGSATFGISTFLFDYVCMNRMVWGAQDVQEVRIRHTSGAPHRFNEELAPALDAYSRGSVKAIVDGVTAAQEKRIDNVDEFLAKRFGARTVSKLKDISLVEEDRPIETIWDTVQAVTAMAREIPHQNKRVELERQAGDLMALAA